MKKVFIYTIVGILALIMIGCNSDAGTSPTTAPTESATTSEPITTEESIATQTPKPTTTHAPLQEDLIYTKVKSAEGNIKSNFSVNIDDYQEGNGPEHIFDGDYESRWSYMDEGEEYELEILLDKSCYIDSVTITWYASTRSYYYEVYAKYNGNDTRSLVVDREDNDEIELTVDKIGGDLINEIYFFFLGNSLHNKWISVEEIDFAGFLLKSNSYEINETTKTITIPADTSMDDFLSKLIIEGSYTAYIGNTSGDVNNVANGNALRITYGDLVAEYLITTI